MKCRFLREHTRLKSAIFKTLQGDAGLATFDKNDLSKQDHMRVRRSRHEPFAILSPLEA
jgi:hypothetical protein